MKNHFVRVASLLLFAVAVAGPLDAREIPGEKIVGSSSPNGAYAIFCTTDSGKDQSTFHVRDLRSQVNISRLIGTGDPGESGAEESARMLFEMIGGKSHGIVSKEPINHPGFSYHVLWNSNNTLLCVEGGAHKFWHCCLYQKTSTGFSEVPFDKEPVDMLIAFAKGSPTKIHNMGVNRFKVKYPYDEPFVHLLEGGYVAVDTHPASCNRAFDSLPEDQQQRIRVGYDLYFLWHLESTGRMKFVGFCR